LEQHEHLRCISNPEMLRMGPHWFLSRRFLTLLPTLMLVVSGVALPAQQHGAFIVGSVTDSSEVGLPSAAVFITNTGPAALTDSLGRYRLSVQPGLVSVRAAMIGYWSSQTDSVHIDPDATVRVDLTLRRSNFKPTCTLTPRQLTGGEWGAGGPAAPDDSATARLALLSFGLDTWRRVSTGEPDSNLLLSPASLSMALSLAYAGATGQTAEAFARTLGVPVTEREKFDTVAQHWLAQLESEKSVEIRMANSLWASRAFPLLPEYARRMKSLYQAEAATVDLTSKAAVSRINGWVSQRTRGRIPKLFENPPLKRDTGMVLINALYFKGKWQLPFDSRATQARPFHLRNGRTIQRSAMSLTGSFRHVRSKGFSGLRLPYAGDAYAMYVLLPDSGAGFGAITALRDSAAWASSLSTYGDAEVSLVLPKFTLSTKLNLNEPLKASGLGVAFDSVRAEFYRMVYNGGDRTLAWIREVRQASMMQVSEEGTEAAAATSVLMEAVPTSAPPPPLPFIVDRPFVIVLRDERSGMLLFIGQIVDPA
jgi:serpin B